MIESRLARTISSFPAPVSAAEILTASRLVSGEPGHSQLLHPLHEKFDFEQRLAQEDQRLPAFENGDDDVRGQAGDRDEAR